MGEADGDGSCATGRDGSATANSKPQSSIKPAPGAMIEIENSRQPPAAERKQIIRRMFRCKEPQVFSMR